MRLNIRQVKAVLWVLNLVALVGVGWFFYRLLELKKAGELHAKPIDEWEKLMVDNDHIDEPQKGPKVILQKELWTVDVTGKETAVAADAATPKPQLPPPSEVKPIDQVLEAKMIFAPAQAVIAYKNDTSSLASLAEKILTVGSQLKPPYSDAPYNAKVLRITKDEIALQWGKDEASLKIGKASLGIRSQKPVAAAANPAAQQILAQYPEPPQQTIQLPGNQIVLSEEDQKTLSNYEELQKTEARVTEVPSKKGNAVKLELRKTDGLLAGLGFESGDILISINDVPIKGRSQAINYVRQNNNLPSYKVTFERRGQQLNKTFYAPRKKGD